MSRKESVQTWGAVLAVLVLTSLATAMWPLITGSFGDETAAATAFETMPIEITLPGQSEATSIQPVVALGILAAMVIGGVVVVGGGLAFLYTFLSRQTANVIESEAYRAQLADLTNHEKEKMSSMQEGRQSAGRPDHEMPRWKIVSNTLIAIMFTAFFAMLISGTFFPEGERISVGGNIVNTMGVAIWTAVIVCLLVAAGIVLRMRFLSTPDESNSKETESGAIPWDFIWVLLSGVLIVGLGIAIMVYLNVPG